MDNNQSKIPRILSADDLANFRYLIKKYGIEPADLSITETINAGGGFKDGGTAGLTQIVTLAKLSSGGTQGQINFNGGILTAYTPPT